MVRRYDECVLWRSKCTKDHNLGFSTSFGFQTLEKYIKNLEINFKTEMQREAGKVKQIRKTCEAEERRAEEIRRTLQVRHDHMDLQNLIRAYYDSSFFQSLIMMKTTRPTPL